MRILNFEQFMAIEGTVIFAHYTPVIIGELKVKVQNAENTFIYEELIQVDTENGQHAELLLKAQETGEHVKMAPCDVTYRNGFFDETDLFAVFTREEVERMTVALHNATTRRGYTTEI